MYIVPITSLTSIAPLAPLESAKPAELEKTGGSSVPFADVLKDAIRNVQDTQQVTQADSMKLALGQTDDLHTVQINSMKAEAAINFTAGLTSKVISAYNEILRIQI